MLIRAGELGATLMVYGTDASSFIERLQSDRAAVVADVNTALATCESILMRPPSGGV